MKKHLSAAKKSLLLFNEVEANRRMVIIESVLSIITLGIVFYLVIQINVLQQELLATIL